MKDVATSPDFTIFNPHQLPILIKEKKYLQIEAVKWETKYRHKRKQLQQFEDQNR